VKGAEWGGGRVLNSMEIVTNLSSGIVEAVLGVVKVVQGIRDKGKKGLGITSRDHGGMHRSMGKTSEESLE